MHLADVYVIWCRLRRVKCDETKPHCLRCTRFGQRCDGYITKAPSKQSLQISTTRTLAPRNPNLAGEGGSGTGTRLSPGGMGGGGESLSPSSADEFTAGGFSAKRDADGNEGIDRFCGESKEVGEIVGQGIWKSFVKSACERDGVVREVLTGVGYVLSNRNFADEGGLTRDLLFFVFERFGDKPDEKILGGLRVLRDEVVKSFGEKKEEVERLFVGMEERYISATVGVGKYISTPNLMPHTFETVEEARESLELVVRKSKHFLRNSSKEREREEIINDYQRWDLSYGPLLKFARSKGSSEDNFLAASLLRLNWLAGWLCVTSTETTEMDDREKRQFRIEVDELTSITELLLRKMAPEDSVMADDEGNEKEDWAWDMQIVVPVMVVGWTCRQSELQKMAWEMLAKSARREGIWDGVLIGKVLKWLRTIEGGNGGEKVESWTGKCRVNGIRLAFDVERRAATVRCLQSAYGNILEGGVERSVEIPW